MSCKQQLTPPVSLPVFIYRLQCLISYLLFHTCNYLLWGESSHLKAVHSQLPVTDIHISSAKCGIPLFPYRTTNVSLRTYKGGPCIMQYMSLLQSLASILKPKCCHFDLIVVTSCKNSIQFNLKTHINPTSLQEKYLGPHFLTWFNFNPCVNK